VSRPRAAHAAGAAALEPIEQRSFRNDYSDVAVLGRPAV
jgi:hypothetical protein